MSGHRLKSLEFLRASCALVVMLNHVYCEGGGVPQYGPIVAVASYSVEAVMGFFVLSGCVISLQDYDSPRLYFRARLLRILPIYYVVLAISLAAMLACGAHFGTWQLLGNLFFLQSLDWNPLNPLGFFIPSWSLSFELYYYAAFMMILLMPRLLLPLLLASIAVGTALYFLPQPPAPAIWLLHAFSFFAMWLGGALIARLVRRGHAVSIGTGAFVFAVGLCLAHVPLSTPAKFDFERLLGFSLGFGFLVWALLSAALHGSDGRSRRTLLDLGLPARLAIAALTLGLLWLESHSHLANKLALSTVTVLFAVAPTALATLVGRALQPATPVMLYVAGLSYALYLVHYPLVQAFNLLYFFPSIVDLFVVVGLSFVLAHALDYVFQPWIRERLRAPGRNRKIPAATTSRSSIRP